MQRPNPPKRIIIDAVEHNSSQGQLYLRVVPAWVELEEYPVVIQFHQENAVSFLGKSVRDENCKIDTFGLEPYQLVVSSYMITELGEDEASLISVDMLFGLGSSIPRFLFLGSYGPDNSFAYILSDNQQRDPLSSPIEHILIAFGLRPDSNSK